MEGRTASCARLGAAEMEPLLTPLSLPTERDERAKLLKMSLPPVLPARRMLEVQPSRPHVDFHRRPCASTSALKHPGLVGASRRISGMGYRLCLDESLRGDLPFAKAASRPVQELLAMLSSFGAYFSPNRKCIGLAADSTWHEVVHEMVHLTFDARVRNAPSHGAAAVEPLRVHHEQLRARGYSERAAEEIIAHEYELRALRTSGAPMWRWAVRALLLCDNGLIEAERDLASIPHAQRSASQAAEYRRVRLLRGCVTGPGPRLGLVASVALGASLVLSCAVEKLGRRRTRLAGTKEA